MDTFGLEPKTFPLKVGHSNRTSSASLDTSGSRTSRPFFYPLHDRYLKKKREKQLLTLSFFIN